MATKAFDPRPHIIDLRGKQYLPVAARLAWFRADVPDGAILNEIVSINNVMIARSTVLVGDRVIATGMATVRSAEGRAPWAGRDIEKAETAAMGRALAVAGYGTLQTDDFDADDDGYLADSPVQRPAPQRPAQQQRSAAPAGFAPAAAPIADEQEGSIAANAISIERTKDGKPVAIVRDGKNEARTLKLALLAPLGLDEADLHLMDPGSIEAPGIMATWKQMSAGSATWKEIVKVERIA